MKNNFGLKIWILLMLFSMVFCAENLKYIPENNQYEGIIRFHVIANSDSEEDQKLKLQVRDLVVGRLEKSLSSCADISGSRAYIEEHLDEISGWAEDCIRREGFDYEVDTGLGVKAIPAKKYGDIYFPAGNYEALTITIGEGRGQNWWCVVFPPLCLIESGQEPHSQDLFEGGQNRIVLKSRILEILNKNENLTIKKTEQNTSSEQ